MENNKYQIQDYWLIDTPYEIHVILENDEEVIIDAYEFSDYLKERGYYDGGEECVGADHAGEPQFEYFKGYEGVQDFFDNSDKIVKELELFLIKKGG